MPSRGVHSTSLKVEDLPSDPEQLCLMLYEARRARDEAQRLYDETFRSAAPTVTAPMTPPRGRQNASSEPKPNADALLNALDAEVVSMSKLLAKTKSQGAGVAREVKELKLMYNRLVGGGAKEGVSEDAEDAEFAKPLSLDELMMLNASRMVGVEDASRMLPLHESGMINNLAVRLQKSLLYVNAGSNSVFPRSIIAMNPFQEFPIWSKSLVNMYRGRPFLAPHIYALGEAVYRSMATDGTNKCVVMRGETGSGKSRTLNEMLGYFSNVLVDASTRNSRKKQMEGSHPDDVEPRVSTSPGSPSFDATKTSVSEKIMYVYCVLEAFGSALCGDSHSFSSSRVGSFYELQFSRYLADSGEWAVSPIGASVSTFLLEDSRVAHKIPSHRNFNIFYYLLAGASDAEKRALHLHPSEVSLDQFSYLMVTSSDGSRRVPLNDVDTQQYHILKSALCNLGFTPNERATILRIIALILHLGRTTFVALPNGQSGVRLGVKEDLEILSALMRCDIPNVEMSLLYSRRPKLGSLVPDLVPKSMENAVRERDAFAASLYVRLFHWIVDRINGRLSVGHANVILGILDPPGFENRLVPSGNSFDQFIRNYAAEKFQNMFNQQVFKNVVEEYTKENIDCGSVASYPDNQSIIDAFEGPDGILTVLDEETRALRTKGDNSVDLSRSTSNLMNKIRRRVGSAHPLLCKFPKESDGTSFIVRHASCDVAYDLSDFLSKNDDQPTYEFFTLIHLSLCRFLHEMFPLSASEASGKVDHSKEDVLRDGGSAHDHMVVLQVDPKSSLLPTVLQRLSRVLFTATPSFVFCIKSNNEQRPMYFDTVCVLRQLRAMKIMEFISFLATGFLCRFSFNEFYRRFRILIPRGHQGESRREDCRVIMQQLQVFKVNPRMKRGQGSADTPMKPGVLSVPQWCEGLTQIFLTVKELDSLTRFMKGCLRQSAVRIQSVWRCALERGKYSLKQNAVRSLQPLLRTFMGRIRFLELVRLDERRENRLMAGEESRCRSVWEVLRVQWDVQEKEGVSMIAEDYAGRALRRIFSLRTLTESMQQKSVEANSSESTAARAAHTEEACAVLSSNADLIMAEKIARIEEDLAENAREQKREEFTRMAMGCEDIYVKNVWRKLSSRRAMSADDEAVIMKVEDDYMRANCKGIAAITTARAAYAGAESMIDQMIAKALALEVESPSKGVSSTIDRLVQSSSSVIQEKYKRAEQGLPLYDAPEKIEVAPVEVVKVIERKEEPPQAALVAADSDNEEEVIEEPDRSNLPLSMLTEDEKWERLEALLAHRRAKRESSPHEIMSPKSVSSQALTTSSVEPTSSKLSLPPLASIGMSLPPPPPASTADLHALTVQSQSLVEQELLRLNDLLHRVDTTAQQRVAQYQQSHPGFAEGESSLLKPRWQKYDRKYASKYKLGSVEISSMDQLHPNTAEHGSSLL